VVRALVAGVVRPVGVVVAGVVLVVVAAGRAAGNPPVPVNNV
jgi:hypothetical protein